MLEMPKAVIKDKHERDMQVHRLACRVYGKGKYKHGRHHWTRYRRCLNALENNEGDFDNALDELLKTVI